MATDGPRGPDGAGLTRRPSMRARQKAQTRQMLRDEALALFEAKGYGSTTVDDIASAVGVSRATFYLHYESKARIVAEVAEDTMMPEGLEFYRRLDAMPEHGGVPLRRWLEDTMVWFERYRGLQRCIDEAVMSDPALEQLRLSHLLERVADAMPVYLGARQGVDRERARLRFELLVLQLNHFARLWLDGHWQVRREVALDVLLDLWTRGLNAD